MIPSDLNVTQVTKRETTTNWRSWKWRSSGDVFVNGAYFVPSGYGSVAPNYLKSQEFGAEAASLVPALTSNAGPLFCLPHQQCWSLQFFIYSFCLCFFCLVATSSPHISILRCLIISPKFHFVHQCLILFDFGF